jgi:hypothetical protein
MSFSAGRQSRSAPLSNMLFDSGVRDKSLGACRGERAVAGPLTIAEAGRPWT